MQTNYMADISLRENKRFDLQKKIHSKWFRLKFTREVLISNLIFRFWDWDSNRGKL